jgi:hypothetical protein
MPRENDKEPSSLDTGNDKKCQNLDAEPSKNEPILRKDNAKLYPCPWCGTPYPSRQALHYHLHNSQSSCRDKQELADRETSQAPPGDLPKSNHELFREEYEAGEFDKLQDTAAKLEGDTPPIPLAIVVLCVIVLAFLGMVLFFWDTVYKFSKKHLGGDTDGPTE